MLQFALSPDGTHVVFTGGDGRHRDIYVVQSDGSGLRRLTSGTDDGEPGWSPDGQHIVFDGALGIEVMNADGSDQTRIFRAGGSPAWAPAVRPLAP